MALVDQMLAAAAVVAAADWGTIQGDLTTFTNTLLANYDGIAAKVAAGGLDEEEYRDDLIILGDLAGMIKDYSSVALKKVAQDAANAAIGVMLTAIKAVT